MIGDVLRLTVLAVAASFAVLALWKGPRAAWSAWRRFGQVLGDAVGRLLMNLLFFSLVVPFAAIAIWRREALEPGPHAPSLWHPATGAGPELRAARRQF